MGMAPRFIFKGLTESPSPLHFGVSDVGQRIHVQRRRYAGKRLLAL